MPIRFSFTAGLLGETPPPFVSLLGGSLPFASPDSLITACPAFTSPNCLPGEGHHPLPVRDSLSLACPVNSQIFLPAGGLSSSPARGSSTTRLPGENLSLPGGPPSACPVVCSHFLPGVHHCLPGSSPSPLASSVKTTHLPSRLLLPLASPERPFIACPGFNPPDYTG
ncbi:hypothetical protein Dimus_013038 [Dionaea muscipula]